MKLSGDVCSHIMRRFGVLLSYVNDIEVSLIFIKEMWKIRHGLLGKWIIFYGQKFFYQKNLLLKLSGDIYGHNQRSFRVLLHHANGTNFSSENHFSMNFLFILMQEFSQTYVIILIIYEPIPFVAFFIVYLPWMSNYFLPP